MKSDDKRVIRELLVQEEGNARSASAGGRVTEVKAIIERLDNEKTDEPKQKAKKLMESEVK